MEKKFEAGAKFEVGKVYATTLVTDSNCVITYEVISRTACTITIRDISSGETKTKRVRKICEDGKPETILPDGSYSMCPVLSADDVVENAGDADLFEAEAETEAEAEVETETETETETEARRKSITVTHVADKAAICSRIKRKAPVFCGKISVEEKRKTGKADGKTVGTMRKKVKYNTEYTAAVERFEKYESVGFVNCGKLVSHALTTIYNYSPAKFVELYERLAEAREIPETATIYKLYSELTGNYNCKQNVNHQKNA